MALGVTFRSRSPYNAPWDGFGGKPDSEGWVPMYDVVGQPNVDAEVEGVLERIFTESRAPVKESKKERARASVKKLSPELLDDLTWKLSGLEKFAPKESKISKIIAEFKAEAIEARASLEDEEVLLLLMMVEDA